MRLICQRYGSHVALEARSQAQRLQQRGHRERRIEQHVHPGHLHDAIFGPQHFAGHRIITAEHPGQVGLRYEHAIRWPAEPTDRTPGTSTAASQPARYS